MLKRLTTLALTSAVILGAAGAAYAQTTTGIGRDYRSSYRDSYRAYARSPESGERVYGTVGRGYDQSHDGTADWGNASPPAGGVGRVDSHQQ